MFKKKILITAGATVVTAALLAGVTYAWFTNTQTATPAQITAGNLGIAFRVAPDSDVKPIVIYPQLSELNTETKQYEPNIEGTVDDVAEYRFVLENLYDRPVLVELSGYDMKVTVPAPPTEGTEVPTENILDSDKVMLNYAVPAGTLFSKIDDSIYVYLPGKQVGDTGIEIVVKAWLDSAAGNEYQGATIDFSKITATAVQYRAAAVTDTFGIDSDDVWAFTNVEFE